MGLHLPNTPHFVIRFFAVLIAGGRVVNFSPLAALRELEYQLTDAETQVMIPANRGLEGHRKIPDAGGLQHRRLFTGAYCPRLCGWRLNAPSLSISDTNSISLPAAPTRSATGPVRLRKRVMGSPRSRLFVLAHGCVREDHVLDEELPVWVPIPASAEN